MVQASQDTGNDIYIGALLDQELAYIDKVEGTKSIRIDIGDGVPRPMHCTAAGLVHLAFAAPELVDRVLVGNLPKLTDYPFVGVAPIKNTMARILKGGVAIPAEHRKSVRYGKRGV